MTVNQRDSYLKGTSLNVLDRSLALSLSTFLPLSVPILFQEYLYRGDSESSNVVSVPDKSHNKQQ